MKRVISAVLCAVLLLTLMPLLTQTASAKSLTHFDIRLEEPVASYTADFDPEFNTDAYLYHTVTWQENSPGFNMKLNSSDEFKAGLAYKVMIWVKLGDGNYFATDTYGDLAAALTVNGKAISSLEIKNRNNNGQIDEVIITCEYDPLPGRELSSVLIKGVPSPIAGQMPIYSFTLGSDSYGFYPTAPVVWWDMTTGKEMDSSDTFIQGHEYQLNIWLQANREGGFTFKTDSNGNPQVTATINSWAADSVTKAYEQEGREVIDIRYTFPACPAAHTCAPKLVQMQKQTCVMPGFKAYYECSCGKCYEDAAGKKLITDLDGYGIIPADGHKEGAWSYNGTHHYKKCTTCMEVIPGTNAAHSGGNANCIKKAECSICGFAYGETTPDHKWSPTYLYKDVNGHAWICADCKTHSAVEPHTPGDAATETTPQTCLDCGYVITPAQNHVHTMVKVERVPATCTENGVLEHYTCSGCLGLFTNPEGTHQVSSLDELVISALGHSTASDWSFDENKHWKECVNCQQILTDTQQIHDLKDDKCGLCGYEAKATPEDTTGPTTGTQPDKGDETGTQPDKGDETGKQDGGADWLIVVLIALVFFAASVTVTVIVLKKKKGKVA